MPVVTTFLIGTAVVSVGQWLIWDGRPSDATRPDPPYSSLANLLRYARGSHGRAGPPADPQADIDAYDNLPDEQFASYHRIVSRQKSLHLKQQQRDASVSALSRKASLPKNLKLAVAMNARQPSLTLSVASSRSSSTASSSAAVPDPQTASATSTAPSTHLLTPEQRIIVLPAQVVNDAQGEDGDGVVGSWLGTMEREVVAGVVGGCGAITCAGTANNKGASGMCECVEDGERSIRGRKMSYC